MALPPRVELTSTTVASVRVTSPCRVAVTVTVVAAASSAMSAGVVLKSMTVDAVSSSAMGNDAAFTVVMASLFSVAVITTVSWGRSSLPSLSSILSSMGVNVNVPVPDLWPLAIVIVPSVPGSTKSVPLTAVESVSFSDRVTTVAAVTAAAFTVAVTSTVLAPPSSATLVWVPDVAVSVSVTARLIVCDAASGSVMVNVAVVTLNPDAELSVRPNTTVSSPSTRASDSGTTLTVAELLATLAPRLMVVRWVPW